MSRGQFGQRRFYCGWVLFGFGWGLGGVAGGLIVSTDFVGFGGLDSFLQRALHRRCGGIDAGKFGGGIMFGRMSKWRIGCWRSCRRRRSS